MFPDNPGYMYLLLITFTKIPKCILQIFSKQSFFLFVHEARCKMGVDKKFILAQNHGVIHKM